MIIMRESLSQYRTRYNRLGDVDEAYSQLLHHKRGMETIAECLDLIRGHRMNDSAGILLLHRHFRCPPRALFVETRLTPTTGHKPILITAPTPQETLPRQLAPYRFQLGSEGRLLPLEFTTDPVVARAARKLRAGSRLWKSIARLLRQQELHRMLGIGIYPRNPRHFRLTKVYVEKTDFERGISVVHAMLRQPRAIGRLIPTLWINRNEEGACCTPTMCVSYCTQHDIMTTGTSGEPNPGGYCGHRREGGHLGCV